MRCFLFIALILALVNVASALLAETSLLSQRDDFKVIGPAEGKVYHEVVFAIKQNNLDQIERLLHEVSDPRNAKYGQFLTRAEVGALTANRAAVDKIKSFLAQHGATVVKTSPYGEYLSALAPVSTWSKMFSTTFHYLQQDKPRARPLVRALEYTLPEEIREDVHAVFNTVQLPAQMQPRARPSLKTSESTGSVTPALLNSYYNIFYNDGNAQSTQSLFESLEQYYSPADLTQFQQTYGLPVEPVAMDIGGYVSDELCVADANNCAEANLDVQYLMGVAQNSPTTYWYEAAQDSFLAWIQAVSAMENPPLVHSISYGGIEPSVPKSIASMFNTEAMKLGLQGVTITVSSGDDGVANFQARTNKKKCGYNPSFPASSPYVTAVGATQGPESAKPEIACTSDQGGVITTGGGFSTLFTTPAYQNQTVATYFANLPANQQPVAGFAAQGRGYPDISSAGFNYEVVIGGKTYMLSGTSASSPVVAGMVSLVNARRLAAGKKPLGFLNPAIYQFGDKIANDVTSGENNCCASSALKVCCDQGFYASPSWDPLTGFGSLDFKKFYNHFFNL